MLRVYPGSFPPSDCVGLTREYSGFATKAVEGRELTALGLAEAHEGREGGGVYGTGCWRIFGGMGELGG